MVKLISFLMTWYYKIYDQKLILYERNLFWDVLIIIIRLQHAYSMRKKSCTISLKEIKIKIL